MLTLRLARAGTKKRPVYHLVATDSRSRRDGRFIENLGYYIPNKNVIVFNFDRIEHWTQVGATMSETARQLIHRVKRHGNTPLTVKPKVQPPPKSETRSEPKAENAVEKSE